MPPGVGASKCCEASAETTAVGDEVHLKMSKSERHFVLRATLKAGAARSLIDTGATISLISPKLAFDLNKAGEELETCDNMSVTLADG